MPSIVNEIYVISNNVEKLRTSASRCHAVPATPERSRLQKQLPAVGEGKEEPIVNEGRTESIHSTNEKMNFHKILEAKYFKKRNIVHYIFWGIKTRREKYMKYFPY